MNYLLQGEIVDPGIWWEFPVAQIMKNKNKKGASLWLLITVYLETQLLLTII